MGIRYRQTCRVCGSENLEPVIDLGDQFLQGSFVKEGMPMPPKRKIPTQLVRCDVTKNENGCGLLQLAHSVAPDVLYYNYWYRSGTNATMRQHLGDIVSKASTMHNGPVRRVLDIGCNDGTLLSNYGDDVEKFGVDPSDIAREVKPPVTVISSVFPSPEVFGTVGDKKFDVITSIAMYYDLEAPVDFAEAIKAMLAPEGVWIVEMSYMPLMLAQNSFDTICHEHLEYYSLEVLEFIAAKAGLKPVRAELNGINGGSIRLYMAHAENNSYDAQEDRDYLRHLRVKEFELELDTAKPYQEFQQRIEQSKQELRSLINSAIRKGQRVHIYGASTKGNVLLQWYGLDHTLIECAADRNPGKHGSYTLGTDIPIVSEEESRSKKPDYYLVLPWHFKAEFIKRERELIESGTKMIYPLPTVHVVDIDNIDEALTEAEKSNIIEF